MLIQKDIDTIRSLTQENKGIIFTDGSSDDSFGRDGAGILFFHPCGNKTELKVPQAWIFTCELTAINEALSFCLSRHSDDSAGGLVLFSYSKSSLETKRNNETNLTQGINILLSQINKLVCSSGSPPPKWASREMKSLTFSLNKHGIWISRSLSLLKFFLLLKK